MKNKLKAAGYFALATGALAGSYAIAYLAGSAVGKYIIAPLIIKGIETLSGEEGEDGIPVYEDDGIEVKVDWAVPLS